MLKNNRKKAWPYLFLVLKDDVEVAFGRGRAVLARPFNLDVAKGLEGQGQAALGNVPRDPAQKDLGGKAAASAGVVVVEVALAARRQLTRPSVRGLVQGRAGVSWKVEGRSQE